MRRAFLSTLVLLGLSAGALGQAPSPDSPTLQALLSEVRALRQELRLSLNRTQSMQILLARLQMQEGVVTRAWDRLNDAREKLLGTQLHQKELGLERKRIEDSLLASDPQQQLDLLDRLNHVKSELEVTGRLAQQQQTAEIQAEQQQRDEQDKLNALESQLDELFRSMATWSEKSKTNQP